ncbi:MAG: WbqC family protein [Bacteroidales bacterium]|nr:WbqC family protein [Bacteroidales bacterium]
MKSEKIVLSTAYLPNIEYFAFISKSEVFFMEGCESFQKQPFRNRTNILTASGVQPLLLPTRPDPERMCIKDVRIDYKCDWQLKHWRAIETAYSGTPYFLYYKDFLYPFFSQKYEFLFDYNLELTATLMKLLKIKKVPVLTETFEKEYSEITDLRNEIHPKRESLLGSAPYSQVFEDRIPFTDNLSVIDLLFNIGPEAGENLNRRMESR